MRRDLRIALLTAGVVLGFGSGVHALRMRHWERRLAWERHMAALCVEAARGAAGHPSPLLLPGDEPGR
ncbi:MAG TPA: hypothetical protein VLT82_03395 [Myxococcaceae bacterium]|nr:hypothetical protein [Myxococcaceae bacterium]